MAHVVQIAVKPACADSAVLLFALDSTGRIWCREVSGAWAELAPPPNCVKIGLDEVIAR